MELNCATDYAEVKLNIFFYLKLCQTKRISIKIILKIYVNSGLPGFYNKTRPIATQK